MEIVVAQLDSHKVKIECSDQTRQTMPRNEEVDNMEDFDEYRFEQRRFEVWLW
jgi:hypothetical protein